MDEAISTCPLCGGPCEPGPVSHLMTVHKRTSEEALDLLNRSFRIADAILLGNDEVIDEGSMTREEADQLVAKWHHAALQRRDR